MLPLAVRSVWVRIPALAHVDPCGTGTPCIDCTHRGARAGIATKEIQMTQVAPPFAARLAIMIMSVALAACTPAPATDHQGYVEGEFVNVASPIAGRLDELAVRRGDKVAAKARALHAGGGQRGRGAAPGRRAAEGAQAQLADLRQGRRLPEVDVTRAQLEQAQVDAQRSATQLARDDAQFEGRRHPPRPARRRPPGARSRGGARRATPQRDRRGRLPSRADQISGAGGAGGGRARGTRAGGWRLDQKSVLAPQGGRVFDTLYREGEWVAAGAPVVRLLPPQNVKLRFFVPQALVGTLKIGQAVVVRCDGCSGDIAAKLTYVSTEAEYTPPVIYSNETRSKLVFMVEAHPSAENAAPRCTRDNRCPSRLQCNDARHCGRRHRRPRPQQELRRQEGGRRSLADSRARRDLRLPRPQRQRQDHLHPHDVRSADAGCRQRHLPGLRPAPASPKRSSGRSAT